MARLLILHFVSLCNKQFIQYSLSYRWKNIQALKGLFPTDQYNRVGIKVGKFPNSIAIDPGTKKVYVTNSYSNTVSVIDGKTGTVGKTIPVGNHPTDIAIDPDTKKVYVTNSDSNITSVIDGNRDTVTKNVTNVGNGPIGISYRSRY